MERTSIGDLHGHVGKVVTVMGHVSVRRDHGKLIFIDLRDQAGFIQIVAKGDVYEAASALKPEYTVAITGEIKERGEGAKKEGQSNGDIEMVASGVEVLGTAQELPFELGSELNFDTYLDYLPYTLRSERGRAIYKVQATIAKAYRDHLTSEGFTEFQAPKIVGGDAEGGASVFELEYFKGQKAFLAQSPQLYKQIMVGVFEKVFTTGNVFRAEKHATSRHTNEYTSIDAELGFIKDHHDVMRVETKLLHYIRAQVGDHCRGEMELLGATLPVLPEEIPHVKMREAQKICAARLGREVSDEIDLSPEEEREMCKYSLEELGSDFIFVTHYPVEKAAWYIYDDNNDPGYTKGFDLLCRGVEITTGGQRVHNYDDLVQKIKDRGLEPENFSFYLQAFKYGMPPHGGWGMGLERLTQKFLQIDNIKEVTLFPRDINRIDRRLSE